MTENDHTPTPFPDLWRAGRNEWWRFALSVVLIVASYGAAVSGLVLALLAVAPEAVAYIGNGDAAGHAAWRRLSDRDALLSLAAILVANGSVLPITVLLVRLLHKRRARTLLTAAPRFRTAHFIASFAVAFGLSLATLPLFYLTTPERIAVSFDPARFALFLPFVLILVPFQVAGEEVFFRGYVLQSVSRFTSSFAVRLTFVSILFAVLHFANTEVGAGGLWAMAEYVVIAFYLTYLALRGVGLEHALGLHMATNLFTTTVLGYSPTSLPASTVFFIEGFEPRLSLASTVAICAAHYLIAFRLLRARSAAASP